LEFLAQLARQFTAVLSLDHLVAQVLESLRDAADFDSCMIGLVDERDPDLLAVVGATGLCAYGRDGVLRHGRGALWATIDAGVPLSISDLQEDPRARDDGGHGRSGIYAPLFAGGRVIGAIGTYRREPSAFMSADLDLLALLATYLGSLFEAARAHEQLAELAFADPLTDLPNRRAFLDRLGVELLRSRRTGRPLSIALVDLDGFKAINDQYGHAAGDAALRQVARLMRRGTRGYDLVARYGGDEFVLLFPDTPRQITEAISRRFREVPDAVAVSPTPLALGLSWGIACRPQDGDAADELLDVADGRLYETKRSR
jgi:diguanylate cyclase (GGDEF)-like protein